MINNQTSIQLTNRRETSTKFEENQIFNYRSNGQKPNYLSLIFTMRPGRCFPISNEPQIKSREYYTEIIAFAETWFIKVQPSPGISNIIPLEMRPDGAIWFNSIYILALRLLLHDSLDFSVTRHKEIQF